MIRVLQVGMSTNYGGLESFIINMYRNIDRSKVQFDFINIYDDPLAYEDEYKKLGANIIKVTKRSDNPIKSHIELKNVINSGKYDFVHFHCMNFCWWDPILIAGKKNTNTRLIVHSHLTGFNDKTPIKEKILHNVGKLLTHNSNYICLSCGKKAGEWLFPRRKFIIINNGINVNKFSFSTIFRNEIRDKYNLKNNDIVIGHVGNFSYQKNYPYLLEVFKKLHYSNERYKLLLIGDERLAGDVKDFIRDNSLDNYVIFTGIVKDTYKYYSAMDIYLYPSYYEGLNISLIEAQCSGLPCFASNTLDPDTNVGGVYTSIDIRKPPEDIAAAINSSNYNYERSKIKIYSSYDVHLAAKKLEHVYENYKC